MKRILAVLAAGMLVGNVAHAQLDTAALEQAMANPADDHTVGPFDPSLGRNTDRIVVKLVRR